LVFAVVLPVPAFTGDGPPTELEGVLAAWPLGPSTGAEMNRTFLLTTKYGFGK